MTTTLPSSSARAFAAWTELLRARGFVVLPASHRVPVELWLREPSGHVLHLRARGTSIVLRRYDAADLTGLILRSECDCEAHRQAGAARRTVLAPGAMPLAEARYDGAAEHGWTGVRAALVDVPTAIGLFDVLVESLPAVPGSEPAVDTRAVA